MLFPGSLAGPATCIVSQTLLAWYEHCYKLTLEFIMKPSHDRFIFCQAISMQHGPAGIHSQA